MKSVELFLNTNAVEAANAYNLCMKHNLYRLLGGWGESRKARICLQTLSQLPINNNDNNKHTSVTLKLFGELPWRRRCSRLTVREHFIHSFKKAEVGKYFSKIKYTQKSFTGSFPSPPKHPQKTTHSCNTEQYTLSYTTITTLYTPPTLTHTLSFSLPTRLLRYIQYTV